MTPSSVPELVCGGADTFDLIDGTTTYCLSCNNGEWTLWDVIISLPMGDGCFPVRQSKVTDRKLIDWLNDQKEAVYARP